MSIRVRVEPRRSEVVLDARLERFEGEFLHGVFPRAYAPGAPLMLRLAEGEGAQPGFVAKAVASKRRDDGDFDVKLRPVDLRRSVRESLSRALG